MVWVGVSFHVVFTAAPWGAWALIIASSPLTARTAFEVPGRLRDPLITLGLWGLDLPVDDRIDPQTARAELVALCLAGTQTKLLDPSRRETFEFHVGDEVFHFQLRHGRFLPRSGPSPTDPTARIACDLQTFMDLALRQLTPSQALKDGRATILAGSRSSLAELFRVLVYTPQAPRPVHT